MDWYPALQTDDLPRTNSFEEHLIHFVNSKPPPPIQQHLLDNNDYKDQANIYDQPGEIMPPIMNLEVDKDDSFKYAPVALNVLWVIQQPTGCLLLRQPWLLLIWAGGQMTSITTTGCPSFHSICKNSTAWLLLHSMHIPSVPKLTSSRCRGLTDGTDKFPAC
jgi:hypothetical protein